MFCQLCNIRSSSVKINWELSNMYTLLCTYLKLNLLLLLSLSKTSVIILWLGCCDSPLPKVNFPLQGMPYDSLCHDFELCHLFVIISIYLIIMTQYHNLNCHNFDFYVPLNLLWFYLFYLTMTFCHNYEQSYDFLCHNLNFLRHNFSLLSHKYDIYPIIMFFFLCGGNGLLFVWCIKFSYDVFF